MHITHIHWTVAAYGISHKVTPGLELVMFGSKKTLNRSELLDVMLLDAVLRAFVAKVDQGREVSIQRVDFGKSPNQECDRLKGLALVETVYIRFEVSINWSDLANPDFAKNCVRVFSVSLDGEAAENKCWYKVTSLRKTGIYLANIRSASLNATTDDDPAKKLEHRVREKLSTASPE